MESVERVTRQTYDTNFNLWKKKLEELKESREIVRDKFLSLTRELSQGKAGVTQAQVDAAWREFNSVQDAINVL